MKKLLFKKKSPERTNLSSEYRMGHTIFSWNDLQLKTGLLKLNCCAGLGPIYTETAVRNLTWF